MRSFQTKLLTEMETIAVSCSLEAVDQRDWANTGEVLAQRGFTTVAKFSYDFQNSRVMILINGAKHGPPGIDNYYFHPTDTERINELLMRWTDLCGGRK